MKRLPLAALFLALFSGCASVPREAILRAQDERQPDSPILVEASRASCSKMREAALLAMARIQAPGYTSAVAERLTDKRASVRELAAWTLGQLGAGADKLRPLLSSPEPGLRAAAYEALGRAGDAFDEPALAAGLRDPLPSVREKAGYALFRLRFREVIPAFSTATLRLQRITFSDPVGTVRRAAVYPFSRFAQPSLADALAVQCGEDEDLWSRLFACRAVGLIGKGAPWEELVALLGPADPTLRHEAVKSLGLIARGDVLTDQVFEDPSARVRAAVADALAASGDRKAAYKLDAIEEEGSGLVRAAVSAAYVKLKPGQAQKRLEKDAKDERWWVRSRAYIALAELGLSTTAIAGVNDPDPRVAAAAIESLPAQVAERYAPGALNADGLPIELLGAVVELTKKYPKEKYLPLLRKQHAGKTAARYPEIREDIEKAYQTIVSTLSLTAEPLAPAPKPAAEGSPWLSARPKPATVTFVTEKGEVDIELAVADAPIHAAAFLDTVKKGTYDGTTWHRVVAGFVVQGGDPRGSGWGDCGFSLRDEINRLPFDRGIVGMPKAGKDTGGCQLFVSLVPTPHLDGRYTAFGRVTRGMDVLDSLEPGDKIVRVFLRVRP